MKTINIFDYYFVAKKLKGYRPKPVTRKSIIEWLQQFHKDDRKILLQLLKHIRFFSEPETTNCLVKLNKLILDKLIKDGVKTDQIIYITIDETASSSHVMLNLLKENAHIERMKCKFIDSKDISGLNDATNKIGDGAIIYIDDFVGSGNQFCRSRDFAMKYVIGNFSEFLLVPCICEEAMYKLGERGIISYHSIIHEKSERPLHPNCDIFDNNTKERLTALCNEVAPGRGLGFDNLATSVIFYRNSPNSIPLVLRGNIGQDRFIGVIPRTTDITPD